MHIVFACIVGFLSGSILWSYLLGQLFYDVDIRNYGLDRNPGAMNAFRAKDFGLELQVGCWTRLRAFFLFTTLFAMLLWFCHLGKWAALLCRPYWDTFFTVLQGKGRQGVATTVGVWFALGFMHFAWH